MTLATLGERVRLKKPAKNTIEENKTPPTKATAARTPLCLYSNALDDGGQAIP